MEEKLLEQLVDIMGIEGRELKKTDKFRKFEEWDSLVNLSVIAMIDEEFGVVIDTNTYRNLITIDDLITEIKRNIK